MPPALVGQLRATLNLTRLAQYTAGLYAGLEAETGHATGFKQTGSLAVAQTAGAPRGTKARRLDGSSFGLEVSVLTPGEAKGCGRFWRPATWSVPFYLPKDGQTNPVDTTRALARGARNRGVKIVEDCRVHADQDDGRARHRRELRCGRGQREVRRQLRRNVGARNRRLG